MSYGKNKLDCFYYIKHFDKHNELKSTLLNLINSAAFDSPKSDVCELNISKTDWTLSQNTSRSWAQFIVPHLFNYEKNIYSELGYNWIQISEIWFQQYNKESEHGWHVHGCNFTNVYYLELPKGTPKTLLIDPFTQKNIIEVNVQEGDIISFPSFVVHKTEKNLSEKRKTIISWNLTVGYPDEKYEEISKNYTI
jgi:hypothetical protein